MRKVFSMMMLTHTLPGGRLVTTQRLQQVYHFTLLPQYLEELRSRLRIAVVYGATRIKKTP
jgi:hypothetical protein